MKTKDIRGVDFSLNDLQDFLSWLNSDSGRKFWIMIEQGKATNLSNLLDQSTPPSMDMILKARINYANDLQELQNEVQESINELRSEDPERLAWKADSVGV